MGIGDWGYSNKTIIITVGNYTSDEEIEEKIILYLKSDINNLLIFQFSNEDCILLNYIKNKIDRLLLEKEYENKVFLLIIYLERIFPVPDYLASESKKINNQYLIPLISGINQVFIDNLNGNEINIVDLLNKSTKELFDDIRIIDKEKEFNDCLYTAFMLIKHDFIYSNDDEEKYVEKCIDFILNNKDFNTKLQNIIIIKLEKEEINIIQSMFYRNVFRKNCTDLISVLSFHLKEIYRETLIKIIIKLDRDGFLNTLMNNKSVINKIPNYISLINTYLDVLNIKDFKYSNELKQNNVEIINYLQIPGSLESVTKTRNYVETIKGEYFENENNFSIYNDDYEDRKNYLIKNTYIELTKTDLIKVFEQNPNFKNKNNNIYYLLINDYFSILIIKKAPNNSEDYLNKNILDFLKILYTLILDQNEENNLQFINIILWFESYSDYIFPLIPLINIMNTLDDSFNKTIDNKINGMLKDNIKNIDKIKKNIKIILYLLYENILNYIFEKSSHLFKNRKNDFKKFINILENSSFFIIQANMIMKLGLKQIYNLKSFIKFKTAIEERENNSDILISYLSCLESDVNFSIMNQNKIILILENEIKLIEKEIKDDKKYDLLIELFSNKIIMVEEVNHKIDSNDNKKENLKISINNYFLNNDDLLSNNDAPENSKIEIEQTLLYLKQFILEKILQDPKLIIRSNYILQLIFNKSNLIPEIPDKILYKSEKDKILNEYPKIKKIDDTLLYILKSNESDFLEEIIIQLFESSFAYYFSEIKKKKI